MGYNTSHWDKEAHMAKKSTKELEELVKFWVEAVERHETRNARYDAFSRAELEYCRMKLAERIGKK